MVPIVSIITPTYNRPARLRECVESVLSQTVPDWEQIVVDDGSEIPAQEVIADLADPRLRVIRQPHVGIWRLADTYNLALENARGKFVAILEDDDLWPARKLQHQLPYFAKSDVALSWGAAEIVDSEGRLLGRMPKNASAFGNESMKNTPPGEILRELLARNIIVACTAVIRKQALLDAGGFQKGFQFVDYPTWLALSLEGPFAFCPETCGVWRVYPSQASSTITIEQQEIAARCALEFFDRLPAEVRCRIGLRRPTLVVLNRDRVAQAHLMRGRFSALAQRRREATEDFCQAFWKGQGRTRVRAAVAIVLTSLKADVEKYVRLFGGIPLQPDLDQR